MRQQQSVQTAHSQRCCDRACASAAPERAFQRRRRRAAFAASPANASPTAAALSRSMQNAPPTVDARLLDQPATESDGVARQAVAVAAEDEALGDIATPPIDAFEQLVRLAVAKDPSLATLAAQHLQKKQERQQRPPASPFASGGPPMTGQAPAHQAGGVTAASHLLGPPVASAAPDARKPPWLRQRGAQGERYTVSLHVCNSLPLIAAT
jgi:hypothetical protein